MIAANTNFQFQVKRNLRFTFEKKFESLLSSLVIIIVDNLLGNFEPNRLFNPRVEFSFSSLQHELSCISLFILVTHLLKYSPSEVIMQPR